MTAEQAQIVLVAAACATGVGATALGLAWLLRSLSITWQLGLVVVASIGSVLLGVVAVARMMFISRHDWEVIALVATISGVVSLAVALVLGAAIARWSHALGEAARTLDAHGSYVPDPRGPSELQDLSAELARTSDRLAESRAREARLEESRRELVSWLSHDLRTPLAGLRAMTESSVDGSVDGSVGGSVGGSADGSVVDPERRQRLIRAEVDRMVRMVDDLVELSRIHAGVLRISPRTVLLADLVGEALAVATPLARARSVRLGASVDHGIELTADTAGMSRVMTNLTLNAIRHTPAGGSVEVRGRAVATGIELSVRDQCGGIPAEEMARLFDVSWTGSPEHDGAPAGRGAGSDGRGAGLGLAVVKGIVEAHRGVVAVENIGAPDPLGCRFQVVLPQ